MSETDNPKTETSQCSGAGEAFSEFGRRFGPPEEVTNHFRQAGLEFLKGIRSLLDHQIETMSRQGTYKGTKINVE